MEQSHKAKITLSLIAASFAVLASLMVAQAFTGPDNPGGVGAGAVSSDTANNVTVGREQTIGSTKLSVVATSTSASNYAFQVFQPNLTSIFWVRNDGEVSIPGALTVGTFTGVSNAGNISSGEFGANTGGGNYSFPASVSIGTAASSAPLHVYRATSGDNLQLALFNKQGTGYGSAYITVQDGSGITQIESNSGGSGPFRFGSYADSVISNPYVGAGPYGSIHLATAGTTRLTVMGGTGATAGYVGIGDTTPSTKLDVSHSVNGFSGIRVNNPNSGGSTTSGIEFYNASNNMARLYSERATNHLVIQNQQGVGNILFKVNAGAITALTLNNDGTGVFVGDLSVPDDSYAAGWDGSLEVPTKNAVFDKIEAGNGVTTAGNVSSGEFGSNTGGGNYTFPTSVKLGPGVGTDSTAGLWWNNSATDYSITRTAGTWSSPNYQQLNIKFGTGIILDPGGSYGKSYVEIPRGGLRVTGGKLGI